MFMARIEIHDRDDARIDCYRDLKDRELAARGGRFIAEGALVVKRFLASGLQAESVLVTDHQP